MKALINLLISLVLASWVIGIAVLSVQNATPVSLTFLLGFRSIQMPVGVVLAFSAGAGLVGGAIALPLFNLSDAGQSETIDRDAQEEDVLSGKW